MTIVIKNNGTKQHYDARKVYGSVYAALFAGGMADERCAKIAAHISSIVSKWVKVRNKITSLSIARQVAAELRKWNKDAAFLYATHRDIG